MYGFFFFTNVCRPSGTWSFDQRLEASISACDESQMSMQCVLCVELQSELARREVRSNLGSGLAGSSTSPATRRQSLFLNPNTRHACNLHTTDTYRSIHALSGPVAMLVYLKRGKVLRPPHQPPQLASARKGKRYTVSHVRS
jgi:hypothetical protein